jgi:hypothetical protein
VTVLPSQTIVGIKRPLTIPYQRAHEAAQRVLNASEGRVDLVVRLKDRAVAQNQALNITIEDGETVIPIALDAENGFVVSPNVDVSPASAEFVVNRRAGEVGVQIDIRPHVVGQGLSASELRSYVQAGVAARKGLLPWYARLVTPTVNSLKVCSRTGGDFAWSYAPTQTKLPSENDSDFLGRPATCVDILAARDPTSDSSRLIAPSDATYDFNGSLF